jgi:cytoplasmic iron level regulating protein YaaA (DUF328/UPF0246 family)
MHQCRVFLSNEAMSLFFLLSPAKTLNWAPAPAFALTQGLSTPVFEAEACDLIDGLRALSPQEIAQLMHLSPALSALNVARYAAFSKKPEAELVRPALFAFHGTVYEALQARTLDSDSLQFAQQHVGILSGLYGCLRPLDGIQAHRLEMGTRLANAKGPHLYAFWSDRLSTHLAARAQAIQASFVINLASSEYSQALNRSALAVPVIDMVFQEPHAGGHRVVGVQAKKARGLMLRWALNRRITQATDLQRFGEAGYGFCAQASKPTQWVFRRQAV